MLRVADVRQTHELLVRHIEAARKHPQLRGATAVLVLESNLAFEAQHIVHALNLAKERGKFSGNWVALSEGAGGTIGWLTVRFALPRSRPVSILLTLQLLFCSDERTERSKMARVPIHAQHHHQN